MLFDLLKKAVSEYSEKIAIKFEDHTITYTKLYEIILKLANGLLNLGVQKGDRVIILLPNLPHFIFAYYALLKIGAIIVPINPLLKEKEIQYIFNETQPSAIIIWGGVYSRVVNLVNGCKNIIMLGNETPAEVKSLTNIIATSSTDEPEIDISFEDTAQIQFTAGAANSPKGVELTYQSLTATTLSCINMFKINSTDIFGGLLPLFLLYSQNLVMNSCFIQGAGLILYPKLNFNSTNQSVFQDKATFLAGSPNIFQMLLESEHGKESAIPLKYALSIGSACSEDLLISFKQKFGMHILEGYGITEASAIISYNRTEPDRKSGSVGLPIDCTKIKIVDENDVELEPGEIGEILVTGKNMMKRYWNQPLEQNGVFKDGWIYTGDLGKIDNEGFLYFIDRKEDVILKGGFYIYPSEVENILLQHPKVAQVSIISIPHHVHKQEVKACIVLKKDQQATSGEIIEFCKEQVPVYKCPQIVQFYNSLPKSATGKILKRKLRKQLIKGTG